MVSAYETRQAANLPDRGPHARPSLTPSTRSSSTSSTSARATDLPRATRPIEVLQPIQALAQARLDYLDSVIGYNRAQFRLKRAIGEPP